MFLFSAKNSAGLFCCRTSAFPAMSSAYLMHADVHPSISAFNRSQWLVIKATDNSNRYLHGVEYTCTNTQWHTLMHTLQVMERK